MEWGIIFFKATPVSVYLEIAGTILEKLMIPTNGTLVPTEMMFGIVYEMLPEIELMLDTAVE